MSPNPITPVEPAQSPTSPFLSNLSKRFRTGSIASRASSQSSDAARSAIDVAASSHDSKSTKRYLQSIVHDDWEYPDNTSTHHMNTPVREAASWRSRDESVSEYDSGSEKTTAEAQAYKFDSPDDIGAAITRHRAKRKRLLDQEMTWNDGLRTWTLRRDAWVGAQADKPSPVSEAAQDGQKRLSSSSGEHNSLSSGAPSVFSKHANEEDVSSHSGHRSAQTQSDLSQEGPYLPIFPPLLPSSHALRSRITPSAYTAIYSKVVIQGLTPNVPIPLNHMINALVQGWKAEGNWPPQGTVQAAAVPRKKNKASESAFRRWKREQEEKKQAAAKRQKEIRAEQEGSNKGVRASISGAVKKAFGKGTHADELGQHDLERLGLTFEAESDSSSDVVDALHTTKL